MSFLSPLILTLLAPWALFALWVFIGRRPRVNVSFLPLWDAPEELRRPKNKAFQPPPLAVVLAILALLMLILAAARPVVQSRSERTLTLIIDRGATMSALTNAGKPRYLEAAESIAQALAALDPPARLRVVVIPTQSGEPTPSEEAAVNPADLVGLVAKLPRTAADTTAELQATLQRAPPGQTLVLTDRPLGPIDLARIIPVTPPPAAPDAGIITFAAREGQVMVSLTATATTRRTLRLTTGGKSIDTAVTLEANPPRTLFLPLPAPGPTIQATLITPDNTPDALEANDIAWLVRQRTWAAVEERTPLPDEVRRMLAVYRRHRPAGTGASIIAIAHLSPGVDPPRATEPAILLADLITSPRTLTGEIRAEPHPALPPAADCSPLAQNLILAPSPGEGWKPILTLNAGNTAHPLVSVRESAGIRQVWIGFDPALLAKSPTFVMLWTSLLDWTAAAPAAGAEEYHASLLGRDTASDDSSYPDAPAADSVGAKRLSPLPPNADPRHWPGLFESPSGDPSAVNTPAITFPSAPSPSDWRSRLASLPTPGQTELAAPLCLLSLLLLTASAATWERRRKPITPAHVPHIDAETLEQLETTFEADGHPRHHKRLVPPK